MAGSPWTSRDFRIVLAGGFINDIGDWLLLVALPVFIYTETGSGSSTAALFVVELVVAVGAGPFIARLVDRWDLRRTLIGTNVAQAVALLPLLAVTADRLWPAYLVAIAQSGLTRLNNPAVLAMVPSLVPRTQLVSANAATASMGSLARLIGSPLGGIVVQSAGLRGVIVADGVSFLAVAAATSFVRTDTSVRARRALSGATPATDVRVPAGGVVPIGGDGLAPRGRRWLMIALALGGIAQGMFLVLFLSFVVDDLHGEGAEVGAIRGVQAVGGVLGSLLIARVAARLDPIRLYAGGLLGMSVLAAVTWNGPYVTTAIPVYVLLFVIVGVPAVATGVGFTSVMQQAVPIDRLGRFGGIALAVEAGGQAAGSLAVGGLLGHVARWTLFDAQAAIYMCAAAAVAVIGRGRPAGRTMTPAD